MKARASPRFWSKRTTWSTPCARATAEVASLLPSSTTSHFDLVEAGYLPRQGRKRDRQGRRLVEAGDLDDELSEKLRRTAAASSGSTATSARKAIAARSAAPRCARRSPVLTTKATLRNGRG